MRAHYRRRRAVRLQRRRRYLAKVGAKAATAVAPALLAFALLCGIAASRADDRVSSARSDTMDTEHLFGFTEGTTIGTPGEIEAEADSTLRSGKRSGSYDTVASDLELKYTLLQYLRISGAATLAYYDIAGVPGLDDIERVTLQAASFNARFRVLDRDTAPFGLTLSVAPHWGLVDETSGLRAGHFGTELLLRADRELMSDRIMGAVNLLFANDRARLLASDDLQHESLLGAGFAVAARASPGLWIGAELRYLRSYEGSTPDVLSGQAVYVGPTLYAQLGKQGWLSLAWNAQVFGAAVGDPRPLDLVNFERHQVNLRLGFDF
jgi:hypothetical protein